MKNLLFELFKIKQIFFCLYQYFDRAYLILFVTNNNCTLPFSAMYFYFTSEIVLNRKTQLFKKILDLHCKDCTEEKVIE